MFAIPALALQTLLTVGAVPRREPGVGVGAGLRLLAIHHVVGTLPVVAVAIAFGLGTPFGFGLFLVAVAPPAALVPAYADVIEVRAGNLLVFVLAGYGLALVMVPALVYVVAGEAVGFTQIALTLGAGLIAPSVLGRLLHLQVVRIPQRVRRGIVNVTVFIITFSLGAGVIDGLGQGSVGVMLVVAVLVLHLARTFGAAWAAARLAGIELRTEAPFAGGFKNIGLAAAVGGSLLGPVAALPALIGFPVELVFFLWLARRLSGPRRAG